MRFAILMPLLLLASCQMTDNPGTELLKPGISRDLAHHRKARVKDLAYDMEFTLEDSTELVQGKVRATFQLDEKSPEDLPLDFDGASLQTLVLNGVPIDPLIEANHIVLPAKKLRSGGNTVQAQFTSSVAPTGTPLTVYRDSSTGRSYFYTLLVPADAHRLFPCFDQPDLKATWDLKLHVPSEWVCSANGVEESVQSRNDGRKTWTFATTPPLPTYLFAFAAGPFRIRTEGLPLGRNNSGLTDPLRIYYRPEIEDRLNQQVLEALHRDSLLALESYFGVRYPFQKLDVVLCPGFPYGGMEHAGSIFYREAALAFDHAPTELEVFSRAYLIAHEVSHQWFGNLVTMEWFDDLWLKEGFATFIGYRMLDHMDPTMKPWLRFHQRVKPAALRLDVTEGTMPIYQELPNLAYAKSAYGPIVYNKAPSVLRELDHRLGEERFRNGVRLFLDRHRFGNARWDHLVACLEESSDSDLSSWSQSWILGAGVPRLSASWNLDAEGLVSDAQVSQSNGSAISHWPLSLNILVEAANGGSHTEGVALDSGTAPLPFLNGNPPPRSVLLNCDDVAYALSSLDPMSAETWLGRLPGSQPEDITEYAESALYETVRSLRLSPRRYVESVLTKLPHIKSLSIWSKLSGRLENTLLRYMKTEDGQDLRERYCDHLVHLVKSSDHGGFRLEATRALMVFAQTDAHRNLLYDLATAVDSPDLSLGIRDRFGIGASLLAQGDPRAASLLDQLEQSDKDVARWAFTAHTAAPTEEAKAAWFESAMTLKEPPEQWIAGSLGTFHWPGQESLTLPYLSDALERVEWVRENRRIFFMPAWLNGFLGAHSSPEALATVRAYLDSHPNLPTDIRRKIAPALHELELAVRIRAGGE